MEHSVLAVEVPFNHNPKGNSTEILNDVILLSSEMNTTMLTINNKLKYFIGKGILATIHGKVDYAPNIPRA